jgi:hypothetical protein
VPAAIWNNFCTVVPKLFTEAPEEIKSGTQEIRNEWMDDITLPRIGRSLGKWHPMIRWIAISTL